MPTFRILITAHKKGRVSGIRSSVRWTPQSIVSVHVNQLVVMPGSGFSPTLLKISENIIGSMTFNLAMQVVPWFPGSSTFRCKLFQGRKKFQSTIANIVGLIESEEHDCEVSLVNNPPVMILLHYSSCL